MAVQSFQLLQSVVSEELDYQLFDCPVCQLPLQIFKREIDCAIFRHAIMKNGTIVGSHASKEEIDKLIATDSIWGCGAPIRLIGDKLEKCDYI